MASSVPNATPQAVNQLLGKMNDDDPDFRFMSLNDLTQILAKSKPDFLHHDYNTASRTVDAVIKALDDKNGEVQNLAVKCIGPLVSKIPTSVIAPTLEKLTAVKIDNSVDNSIASTALRNAVAALPKPIQGITPTKEVLDTYTIISRVLIPRLLGYSTSSSSAHQSQGNVQGLLDRNKEISPESVDVLIEVVRCYGPLLQSLEVEKLQEVVVQVLERNDTNSTVKKRAVVALAVIGPYLTDQVLNDFITRITKALNQPKLPPVMRRLYITVLGSLARSIPHQFGQHLPTVAPLILAALNQEELQKQLDAIDEGDDQSSLDFNEVVEAALVAVEAFLASCGAQMRDFTQDVIASGLRYLKYDPNYAADDDEDMEEDEEEDEDELDEDDEFEDAGFDDDDDASWKVRRCAAKALYTLISTRSSDLLDQGTLYGDVAVPLIKRFDEREESVRLEVIGTLALLIRKTGEGVIRALPEDEQVGLLQSLPESRKRRRQSSGGFALSTKAPYLGATGLTSPAQEEVPPSGPRADLSNLTPQIVKTSTKLLKGKQLATKQAVVKLLDDLVLVQHGGLADYFDQVMEPIIEVTKGSTGTFGTGSSALSGGAASATASTLRVSVLGLISDIAKTHSSNLFQPFLSKTVTSVIAAIKDRFYKVSSEAIATAEELVKAITPPRARFTSQKYTPELHKLYEILVDRASANDADTEVRQKAIQALGTLLSRTSGPDGTQLLPADKRQEGLALLLDRLYNETTRLHAVRAIDNVTAHSVAAGTLESPWIQSVALELCGQLRKSNRLLRGSSIQALQHLILSPATKGSIQPETVKGIVAAILPVMAANDSQLLGPALLVLAQLQLENPKLVATPELIENLCALLKKSVTGGSLDSMITLVINVAQSGGAKTLMQGVLQVGVAGDPAVVGKIAGTVYVASGGDAGVKLDNFINELQSARDKGDPTRQCLALAVLGEIGLRLGPKSPLEPELFLKEFSPEPDKVSMAAAVALGRAGAGNVAKFMPVILTDLKSESRQQYLLLQAIREVLLQVIVSSTDISSYENEIWELLFAASQVEDNKAICAECIGRLAIISAKNYIPKLQELLQNPSPAFRAVAVQAIRYTLPDSDESFDAVIKPVLVDILLTVLQDKDMEIRRLAMTTLNSATHNKPELVLPHLGELVPFVMAESKVKPELIREVMMGPFKHLVDDGLEVRKSAYETLYALMETAFSRISTLEFYDRVIAGLNDDNDIRALCNLMVSKLIVIDPEETTRRLDTIAECYRKTLSTKLKEGSVKQEVEKQEEANKSVLRVTLLLADKTKTALSGVSAGGAGQAAQTQQAASSPIWQQYWEWVNKDFERQLKALREENKELS